MNHRMRFYTILIVALLALGLVLVRGCSGGSAPDDAAEPRYTIG